MLHVLSPPPRLPTARPQHRRGIARAIFPRGSPRGGARACGLLGAEGRAWPPASAGPRHWPPLLYLCHTALGFGAPTRPDGLVAIGRRLLALGADPNERFPWF